MRLLDFFGEDPNSDDRSIPFLPGNYSNTSTNWHQRGLKSVPRSHLYQLI